MLRTNLKCLLALLLVSSSFCKSYYNGPTTFTANLQEDSHTYHHVQSRISSDIRGGSGKVQKKELQEVQKSKRTKGLLATLVDNFYKIYQLLLPSSLKSEKTPRYGKHQKSNTNSKKKRKEKSEINSPTDSGSNRIQKELKSFLADPPENCDLTVGKNIRSWIITLTGVQGTIFGGEKYKLQVTFPKDYPTKPPSVFFLKPCPKHVHVYSNGDICLNLLGKDWRPTMTIQGIAVSILSMLSSAKEKSMPQDNAMHAEAAPGQQQDNWMYHDDKC
eukprot:gene24722-33192_t